MKNILVMLVLIITIAGCSVNKQITDLNTSDSKSIVGGKIKIIYNKKDVTPYSRIYFKNYATGKLFNYSVDESGILMTKLPPGRYYMSKIIYSTFSTEIREELVNFEIKDNKKILYLGELTVNWAGPQSNSGGYFGLVGGVVDALLYFSEVEIYSKNNIEDFRNYLSTFYNSQKEAEYIDLNLPNIEEFKENNKYLGPSDNTEYFAFNIAGNKIIYGELRMIKRNEIYVEEGKKLYIFDRDKLISIKDFENNDVTEELLQRTDFEKIRFNSYEIIDL